MATMNINKTASAYNRQVVWLITALTIGGFLLMQVLHFGALLMPLAISAFFSLMCAAAYVQGWKAIARRSPALLPKYYLAGSAFRLLAAAMVMLVYCVVERADVGAIKWFAVVFIIFYIVLLIFDALFFAKVSKNINK